MNLPSKENHGRALRVPTTNISMFAVKFAVDNSYYLDLLKVFLLSIISFGFSQYLVTVYASYY